MYSVYLLKDMEGNELKRWYAFPERIDLPNGDIVFSAPADWSNGVYSLTVLNVEDPPTRGPLL